MLIFGLFLFVLLVVVHEYGHFLVAKRNGVEVEEFGIGFPPKLIGKTMGKGIFRGFYTLNLLPFGGFVKLKGENAADKSKGSFGAASFKAQAKIMLAGVTMNFLTAVAIFSVVAAISMPVVLDNQFAIASDTKVVRSDVLVAFVVEDSPAEAAGLEVGDKIRLINGNHTDVSEDLSAITKSLAGEEVSIEYVRDGSVLATSTTLNAENSDDKGYLGVSPVNDIRTRATWSAPIVGLGFSLQLTWESLSIFGQAIGGLFTGSADQAADTVVGPVGIVRIFQQIEDASTLLFLIGGLSLSLAIMNTLPIPALDGGRLALYALYRLLNRPLSQKTEERYQLIGMTLLLTLAVGVTVLDVQRFF